MNPLSRTYHQDRITLLKEGLGLSDEIAEVTSLYLEAAHMAATVATIVGTLGFVSSDCLQKQDCTTMTTTYGCILTATTIVSLIAPPIITWAGIKLIGCLRGRQVTHVD